MGRECLTSPEQLTPRDGCSLSLAPKVTASASGYQNAFSPDKDTSLRSSSSESLSLGCPPQAQLLLQGLKASEIRGEIREEEVSHNQAWRREEHFPYLRVPASALVCSEIGSLSPAQHKAAALRVFRDPHVLQTYRRQHQETWLGPWWGLSSADPCWASCA